ncbi:hypothetical protein BJX65DRAFT_305427 [Aspergillus insuetus]
MLRLPRSLKRFSIILSLNYRHNRYQPKVTLDSAPEPVTDSLKVLDISIPYSSSAPEGVSLSFSSRSLTAFKFLRDLYIPEAFLNEGHGFDGTRPWFPSSLVSLGFSNAWPPSYARSLSDFNRGAVAVPFEHTGDSDKVNAVTKGALARVLVMLKSLPCFTTINVPCK